MKFMLRWLLTGITLAWLGFLAWAGMSGFLFMAQIQQPVSAAEEWCSDNTNEVGKAAVELGLLDSRDINEPVEALVSVGNLEARRPADYDRACAAAFAGR